MDIVYQLRAAEDDRARIEGAIKASQTRFCGVSEMLRRAAVVTWKLELQPL